MEPFMELSRPEAVCRPRPRADVSRTGTQLIAPRWPDRRAGLED